MVELPLGEHFGLSIPTDEAINVLNDTTLKGVDTLLINVKTLTRNFLSSLGSGVVVSNLAEIAYDQVLSDMNFIKEHVESNFDTQVIYYNNDYRNLKRKKGFQYSVFKEARTEKQIQRREVSNQVINHLLNQKQVQGDCDSMVIGDANKSSIILTHLLIDLMANHTFKDLNLLESHTGAIKGYSLWGKKLNVRKEWKDYFPLNALTLNVLGDGELFAGSVRGDRQRLFEIAQKSRWNGATTRERVRYCISQNKDDYNLFKDYLD